MPKTNWICRNRKKRHSCIAETQAPFPFSIPPFEWQSPPPNGSHTVTFGNHGGFMSGQRLGPKVPLGNQLSQFYAKLPQKLKSKMYKFLFCLPFKDSFLGFFLSRLFLGILFCFRVLRHLCHYFHHVDCGAVAMKVNRKKHGNRYKNSVPHKVGRVRMMNLPQMEAASWRGCGSPLW